ncbi:hypothetical protein ACFOHS_22585, partial [Jhaorihella thermophila]
MRLDPHHQRDHRRHKLRLRHHWQPREVRRLLGTAAGASNLGIIWPEAFWADTPIVLTANGGDFTGGAVRIAI